MATMLHVAGQFEMPLSVQTLDLFRKWSLSDDFPEKGRIDFITGRIEVDMSPERFFSHGKLKVELIRVLANLIEQDEMGHLLTDSMRVSSPQANLSVEPDLVFISNASLTSGHVRLIPSQGTTDDFIEIEGAPSLIVEIVSDSSVRKDTHDLPIAYYAAGIEEYWIADARGEKLAFQIHHRGKEKFEPTGCDPEGYQQSAVLDRRFRLERRHDQHGFWQFELINRE